MPDRGTRGWEAWRSELEVWGEDAGLFRQEAEDASQARALRASSTNGKKGFACLRYVLSPLGDGGTLSNFFLLLYVRSWRVQEKEA